MNSTILTMIPGVKSVRKEIIEWKLAVMEHQKKKEEMERKQTEGYKNERRIGFKF